MMLLVLHPPRIQETIMENISQFIVTSTKRICGFITNVEGKHVFYLFKMMSCEVHAPV